MMEQLKQLCEHSGIRCIVVDDLIIKTQAEAMYVGRVNALVIDEAATDESIQTAIDFVNGKAVLRYD